MITIQIDNENNMNVCDFTRFCEAIAILKLRFPKTKIEMQEVKITGDLSCMSSIAQKYYKKMVKNKCINNLRVLKG